VSGDLDRGRESYAAHEWQDAYQAFCDADRTAPLGPGDLDLLATSAYMVGRDEEWARHLERAHRAYLDAGEPLRAVRCAFWLSLNLALHRETGRATGWLGRGRRLLERVEHDSVERGYLLVPVAVGHHAAGEYGAAHSAAAAAAAIGERFGDADLFAVAVHEQGNILVEQGRVAEGLALLDEAMVAVTSGELSPIVTGLVYCSVIDGCRRAFELRRAQEWTNALARWCEQQPAMVAFTGKCLVDRAAIMLLRGAWPDALAEARRAGERCAQVSNPRAAGEALYCEGEIHRLRGELAAAEEAYREASRRGPEAQPGLALLRLAQGKRQAAIAAIRRVLEETYDRPRRARLLPAHVDIALAAGEVAEARRACAELEEIADDFDSRMLRAIAAHARGAVELERDPRQASVALHGAREAWQELDAPYEAARVRVLMALACRALGDDDAAAWELEEARGAFAALGAAPDVARVDALARGSPPTDVHGLTLRELQVLRLIASGETNKAIAAELVLSERTVDRHVSNIFTKLGLSSRAAATAFAYEHELV
jgi:DNA-binding NarL/FixJ family response regulator